MKKKSKSPKGQLVRLTRRDYHLMLDLYDMALELHYFDEHMAERWAALRKIRVALYPRKAAAS